MILVWPSSTIAQPPGAFGGEPAWTMLATPTGIVPLPSNFRTDPFQATAVAGIDPFSATAVASVDPMQATLVAVDTDTLEVDPFQATLVP